MVKFAFLISFLIVISCNRVRNNEFNIPSRISKKELLNKNELFNISDTVFIKIGVIDKINAFF